MTDDHEGKMRDSNAREDARNYAKQWHDLYELLAMAIASVDPQYQADLCRDFRINPNYVNDCRKDLASRT